MRDESKVAESNRLLIKVILPKQGRERPVPGGGSEPKPFRVVDNDFRNSLVTRIIAIRKAIELPAQKIGGAPVRVQLVSKAIAKSHRPEQLFSADTCPIIGAGKPGELFLRATANGLRKIERKVEDVNNKKLTKEVSTIETIEPVTPKYRRRNRSSDDILKTSPKVENSFATRVQLFDFGMEFGQERLVENFNTVCEKSKIKIQHRGYSQTSHYYEAFCRSVSEVEILSKIDGVRLITGMPVIRSIKPKILKQLPIPEKLPGPISDLNSYPVVAVVDSGISSSIPHLKRWIFGRDSRVAEEYRNNWHGTFVAGLICHGCDLNQKINDIDHLPCAVFDLQVMPNSDPGKGRVEFIRESQLLQDIESALIKYSDRIKVWNLSLGSDEICSLDDFSPFAVELDNLQETYNVTFVISAGNYEIPPLLDYPRSPDQVEKGRITAPADSVLGISVGSVSHLSYKKNGPNKGEPSAFSRHGPGPNYVIKPDLVHYGGSCTTDGRNQSGIHSISEQGMVESLGTSYSAPFISKTLANIYHYIIPTPSPELAKAIMIHGARDPRNGSRVPDNEENYIGFGVPTPSLLCLECYPWTSTLIFEDTLRPGYFLEWDNFPYPDSLRKNGKYLGNVWMTLAFSPVRGERWGSEYCETHIDAKFGVYYDRRNRETREVTKLFKGLVPPEHKNPGILYESYQVEKLRKWAPVRTYYGSLGTKGERGNRWRLRVNLLSRHEVDKSEIMRPQKFALILTIADPRRKAAIYNEMAVKIRSRFKIRNLNLRPMVRIKTEI